MKLSEGEILPGMSRQPEHLERGLLFGHPSIDEIALEIGQFRLEQPPITVDVVAMGTDTGQVLFEHRRPS
jgi:hypothetical protein